VLFCVFLCIVVRLLPGTNPFAVNDSNNNKKNKSKNVNQNIDKANMEKMLK
jgi:hypothetical protein